MIVAGFGFSTRATPDSLRHALQRACTAAQITSPCVLATPQDKVTALALLAQDMGLPIQPVAQDTLATQDTPTQSPRVASERGTGSVAEASALAVAGPGGRLLTSRIHAHDRLASCALAEGNPT